MANHPDWINTNSAPQAVIGLVKDAVQLGYKGSVMVSGTELTLAEIQSLGSEADRLLFVSPFPPVADAARYPALQQFMTDMKAEAAAGNTAAQTSDQYVPFLAMNDYFAMLAMAEIANKAKAVDSASFKSAIDSASNVFLWARDCRHGRRVSRLRRRCRAPRTDTFTSVSGLATRPSWSDRTPST